MLIIEGADLLGKTTLAHKLCERLGLLYQHMSAKLPMVWRDEDYMKMIHQKTCRDRFHLSEVVYSEVLDRRCKVQDLGRLCSALTTHGAWTLVLVADAGLLHERLARQSDSYQSADTVMRANEKYFNLNPAYIDQVVYTCPKMPFVPDATIDIICQRYLGR